jgi:hypothetical protein
MVFWGELGYYLTADLDSWRVLRTACSDIWKAECRSRNNLDTKGINFSDTVLH